uniref:Uncharacterized protein n=1 Tax=Picea sitchensis TaxID=3332 RepID=B8LQN5_PICSI|nr:unknown [Picea sitchensis]
MSLRIVQAINSPALAQIPCKEQRQSICRNTQYSGNGVHVGEQGLGSEIAQIQ